MENQKLREFAEFLDDAKKDTREEKKVFVYYKGVKRELVFSRTANAHYTIDGITEEDSPERLYLFSAYVYSSMRIGKILPDLEWVEKPAIQEVI